MSEIEELRQRLSRAVDIADTLDRRLWVLAVITKALEPAGITPILVGGAAVEFYTGGGYATKDIDVVVPAAPGFARILSELGFSREGRHWFRDDLEIVLEAPGEELAGDLDRITQVQVDDLVLHTIGIEDLIVDRLNAAVHWRSVEDGRWAARLVTMNKDEIDFDYLRRRSSEEGTSEALARILAGGD